MRSLPKPPLSQALGDALHHIRTRQGLSQEDAAWRCGIDRAHYGHLERGEHTPTLATLWKIAEGLQVKPATIIRRAERHMDESP